VAHGHSSVLRQSRTIASVPGGGLLHVSRQLADQSARERIRTELTRSLLVEAGAGSGKTHELAARMAAGVAEGVYDVPAMAAVTFTRKAAAELRGRFQRALEDELSRTTDPGRRVRILNGLGAIERFFAGTIHAFCARLLRERPVEAGVAPGFAELDDVEERMLRRRAWVDYRAQASATGDPDRVRLEQAGISLRDLDKAFEVVSLHEDVTFPCADVPAPAVDGAWRALEAFWARICDWLPDPIPPDTSCTIQQKAVGFRGEWAFHKAHGDRSASVLAGLLDYWNVASKVTQKYWTSNGKQDKAKALAVQDLHARFRDETAGPWLRQWRESLYGSCVRVLMHARRAVAEQRRRRSKLTFNDLLLLTEQLLRTNADVRAALQRKYRFLFVDEFQDTDPLQARIMRLLAGQHGVLFVVGDPKQSIYRFRRADIDSYHEMRTTLAGADGRGIVALTTNFRSVESICTWANAVFAECFPAEPSSWQPAFAPLVPRRVALPQKTVSKGGQARLNFEVTSPGVCKLTIESAVSTKDLPRVCASKIATYIASEVAAGRRSFGDFLIITRKKRPLSTYAAALEALHVPIEVSGAGAFGGSSHVADLAGLLDALSDPQDAVALVGVLRGSLFGLSDPQLFAWCQAGGYIGLFSEINGTVPAEAAPVGEALVTLRRWYGWVRQLPPGAALERILEESGFLALAASSAGGGEAGDLLHAVDRVRLAVENGFTLSEAAESLGEDAEESSEVESLPLEPGRSDVVRLMNLHKAKGLEAPVVILADPLGTVAAKVDWRIVRNVDGTRDGEAIGWLPILKPFGPHQTKPVALPPGWDELETEERRYLEAEEKRLLYVAATRAKDLLIVSRHAKAPDRGVWGSFEPFLGDAPELEVPSSAPCRTFDDAAISAEAASEAAAAIEAAHERIRQSTWHATSVTAEVKQVPRLSPVDPADVDQTDPTGDVVRETPSRRADAGLAWGALVHGLLEHAVRHPVASREDLRRLALWLTFEDPSLRPVIDTAIDTALAVVASDKLRRAQSSDERHAEVPFAVVVEDEDGRPAVVTGAIDLVYRDGGVWCIVDYKTDCDTGPLRARYEAQVKAYADAWERIVGGPVTTAVVSARQ
jgi:ATP-dependent helicase/nuclease subunit A